MIRHSQAHEPEADPLRQIDAELSIVLEHPGMSDWVKASLLGALRRDPTAILNDLEILNLILRKRSLVLISQMLASGSAER